MADEVEHVPMKAGSKENLTEFREKLEKFSVAGESSVRKTEEKDKNCFEESSNAECAEISSFEKIDKARHDFLRKSENSMIRLAQEEFAKIVPKTKEANTEMCSDGAETTPP